MNRIVLITLALLINLTAESQVTFTDVSTAGPGLGDGTARGIAWADFNNDGLQDVFVPTAGTVPNKLYMNNGDGSFSEVAAAVGLNDVANTITCVWADIDNDGDLDLLTTATSVATRLWRNNRETGTDTTFTSIEVAAGINMSGAQMAAWADYNRDGFIDFYSPISNSAASSDALYRNNGDNTFTNVADSAGVNHQVSGILEQAVHWGDYDKDGYLDLFIGNLQTGGPSFFHHNNGDGTFTEISATLGFTGGGRGAQWVDYNNDGLWDFSWAGYAGATATIPVKLFRNNGDGTFTDVATAAGLTDAVISWGVTWADYNNDGYEDLFVAVSGQSTNCLLYRNNGNGTFTNATSEAGLAGLVQLSGAWADYDNDGDMDLYTSGSSSNGNHLFKNNGDSTKHWLKVQLVGSPSNKAGIGAQIFVKAGTLRMMREVNSGLGYRSQNMLPAHLGLDAHTVADSVIVHWPSGITSTLTNINADQTVTITEQVAPLAPNIATNRDTIKFFGTIEDTMIVWNTGNALLTVDSIVIGPGAGLVRVQPQSFNVAPADSQEVIVYVIITDVLVDTASMYMYSNDPDDSVLVVRIVGSGIDNVKGLGNKPDHFALEQNYPNPFNPSTSIKFKVQSSKLVTLRVYNLLGQEVATLVNEELQPGSYEATWDARPVNGGTGFASGIYFYRITAGEFTATKKLVLLR